MNAINLEDQKIKFPCEFCGKFFSTKSNLSTHLLKTKKCIIRRPPPKASDEFYTEPLKMGSVSLTDGAADSSINSPSPINNLSPPIPIGNFSPQEVRKNIGLWDVIDEISRMAVAKDQNTLQYIDTVASQSHQQLDYTLGFLDRVIHGDRLKIDEMIRSNDRLASLIQTFFESMTARDRTNNAAADGQADKMLNIMAKQTDYAIERIKDQQFYTGIDALKQLDTNRLISGHAKVLSDDAKARSDEAKARSIEALARAEEARHSNSSKGSQKMGVQNREKKVVEALLSQLISDDVVMANKTAKAFVFTFPPIDPSAEKFILSQLRPALFQHLKLNLMSLDSYLESPDDVDLIGISASPQLQDIKARFCDIFKCEVGLVPYTECKPGSTHKVLAIGKRPVDSVAVKGK